MYKAIQIARWFVEWASAESADLSNLKLQKLLYYAQGWNLAKRGTPLFEEEIQAWSHGPVVPTVYRAFRDFGSGDITLDGDFDWDSVDPETTQLLADVWSTYGVFGAWQLRNMTHDEPPWRDHFTSDERFIEIPIPAIEKHFQSRLRSAN